MLELLNKMKFIYNLNQTFSYFITPTHSQKNPISPINIYRLLVSPSIQIQNKGFCSTV